MLAPPLGDGAMPTRGLFELCVLMVPGAVRAADRTRDPAFALVAGAGFENVSTMPSTRFLLMPQVPPTPGRATKRLAQAPSSSRRNG